MGTNILIIEDEPAAAEKLARQLQAIDSELSITGTCASIKEGIQFLKESSVDLILSDIHLADGLSFEIFRHLQTDIPIIFTTAYDQYAIEAFKTNSIDYLLKPIKKSSLFEALEKFKRLHPSNLPKTIDFSSLIESLNKKPHEYKERFLLEAPNGELNTVQVAEIAYFCADGKYTFAICSNGRKYFTKDNISKLIEQLDPKDFFQLNRKFIAHIHCIEKIIKYSKSRLKLQLLPPTEIDVIISSDKTPGFKEWLGQ